MNYRYNRRPPKRRITGRFYAFLTALLMLVVALCVFINVRSRPQLQTYNNPVYDPQNATVQTAPPVNETPVVQSDPVQSSAVQVENPTEPPVVEQTQTEPEQTAQTQDPGDETVSEPSDEDLLPDEGAGIGVGDDIELEPLPAEDFTVVENLKARTDLPKEWTNILLLGSDSRDMKKTKKTRCDSIIIASINGQTGQMKMTSIMRDLVIEIPGHGMQKINACTYYGGPEMMMQVINTNFGLNITQYAVVNFGNMAKIIDVVDGVFVDVTKKELEQINRYMGNIAMYTMTQEYYLAHKEEWKLKTYGNNQRLTGIQAVTYARIRHIDSDYQRTQRQRNVINALMTRVKDANPIQLMQIGTEAIKLVSTNVSITSAVGYAMSVLGCKLEKKDRIKEWRIPSTDYCTAKNGPQGSGFYDVNYEEVKNRVYKFIYQT